MNPNYIQEFKNIRIPEKKKTRYTSKMIHNQILQLPLVSKNPYDLSQPAADSLLT